MEIETSPGLSAGRHRGGCRAVARGRSGSDQELSASDSQTDVSPNVENSHISEFPKGMSVRR